jgi:rubrerythrin
MMATFKCSDCGATEEGRCKPKKCPKCGAEGKMEKKESGCGCKCC